MTQTQNIATARPEHTLLARVRALLPGLVLCLAAAGASYGVSLLLPGVSPLIIAIVLGVLLANVVRLPAAASDGIDFSAKKLLRAGIVRARRAGRYRRADDTQKVLLDYGRLERVLRYLGEDNRQHLPVDEYAASLQIRHLTVHEGDFAKALELAQKARFSKGGCTAEERRWMEAFVAHFSKRVYKDLSLPKQFSFRLLHLN